MTGLLKDIVFERRYRMFRHILFWIACLICFCVLNGGDIRSLDEPVEITLSTLPIVIAYAYMVTYAFVPVLLLKQ